MPVLLSYIKQSIDLLFKSIDWYLYESNTGISWVKLNFVKSLIQRFSFSHSENVKRGFFLTQNNLGTPNPFRLKSGQNAEISHANT